MKKILAVLGLTIALATSAQATMFIGLDYIPSESGTTTSVNSIDTDYEHDAKSAFSFKLGGGQINSGMSQLYYSSYDTDHSELGYDYKHGFDVVSNLQLFLKVGLAYGWYIDPDSDYSQAAFGWKAGLGTSYIISDSIELAAGWDYKAFAWGNSNSDTRVTNHGALYFGASFWFGSATGNKAKPSSNNQPARYQDDNVNSSQKYNSHDQQYNGSSNSAEDVVY